MAKRQKLSNGSHFESFYSEENGFDYSGHTVFKAKKHPILNSQVTVVDPRQTNFNNADPKQLDFEIQPTKCLLMSPMFRFEIRGTFQQKRATKKKNTAATPPVPEDVHYDWEKVPKEDASKVLVQPNWMDFLIKSVEVYSGISRLTTNSEDKSLTPHLNTFINLYQDKDVLKLSAPQDYHPYRYCFPLLKDKLNLDCKEWKDYAEKIFRSDQELIIDYYPRVFPFVQSVNKFHKSDRSKHLPLPLMGKLNIRVTFADDLSSIFRKATGNNDEYRFFFEKFRLIIEEGNLSNSFEKSLLSTKKTLTFPGMCRHSKMEMFPVSTTTFRTKFNDTFLPEGLLIMAMNKKIANSQYSFAQSDEKNLFLRHNIKKVELTFNHQSFEIKEPMFGNVEWDFFDVQKLKNHLHFPIFGVVPDKKHLDFIHFENSSSKTSFPHIYFPLTQFFGDNTTRKVPSLDDGSCLSKRSTLDIFLTFDQGGSTDNAMYVFVIFFTDYCLAYDPRNKIFLSPHDVAQG